MTPTIPEDAPREGWTFTEQWVLSHPPYKGEWRTQLTHPDNEQTA